MKKLLRNGKAVIALLVIIGIMSSLIPTAAFAQVDEASPVAETGGQIVVENNKGQGEPVAPTDVTLGDVYSEVVGGSHVTSDSRDTIRSTSGGPRIIGNTLRGSKTQGQALMQESVAPIGAVMAFDSTTCPSGWTPYTEAEGRMIIGVGNSHTLGEVGGSESHSQTPAELAPHTHGATVTGDNGNSWVHSLNQNGMQNTPGNNSINYVSVGSFSAPQVNTGVIGNGQAFDIRNPYIALIYCIKVVDNPQDIPASAVMAFASTTCPSGWSEFADAAGRRVVGAGGIGGQYEVGETGGKETHVLKLEEMATHSHSVSLSGGNGSGWAYNLNQNGLQYTPGNNSINYVSVGSFDTPEVFLSSVGQAAPMDIMNPYVVLTYCVKVVDTPQATPAGAVAAFDSAVCPSGWEPYAALEGRTIIGAGNGRVMGNMGGSETHAVTEAELPPHTHGVSVSGGGGNGWVYHLNQNGLQYTPGNNSINYVSGGNFSPMQANVSSSGGGVPMNIMNPYITLQYCGFQVDGGNGGEEAGFTVVPTELTMSENGGTGTFTVVLDIEPASNVVMSVVTGPAEEATSSPSMLTFTPANWNVPQTVTVTGVDDSHPGTDHATSTVSIVDDQSADAFDVLADQTVAITLLDDGDDNGGGEAGFTVFPTALTIAENGGTGTFNVVLNVAPTSTVTFNIAPSEANQVSLSTTTLTFTPADWNVSQVITVTGINDDLDQDDSVVLNVSVVDDQSADAFDLLADQTVTVTLTDDDTTGGGGGDEAGFTVFPTTLTIAENGGAGTFSVVLDVMPTTTVSFNITPSKDGEVLLSTTTVTFNPTDWNVPQVITVTGINDNLDQDDSVVLNVSVIDAVSDDAFDVLADQTVTVTLTDDESPAGGGGGSSSGGGGRVLGVSTGPLTCDTEIYLTKPVRLGSPNNPTDVILLERFLNTYEGANIPVDGFYSLEDHNLVVKWHEKYSEEILKPWGLTHGTGFVFITSLQKIKQTHKAHCAESEIPTQILSCSLPIIVPHEEVRFGAVNNPEAVKLVEKYLNTYESASLPVNGVYSVADRLMVKKFQEKYAKDILAPEGLKEGTGDVLYRSLQKMKEIHVARCKLFVINPEF